MPHARILNHGCAHESKTNLKHKLSWMRGESFLKVYVVPELVKSQITMSGSFEKDSKFKPVIVGFLCNWCAYAGADLAGTSRIQYPPNIRIIRVMCSGRVDPVFILEAFRNGADGVLVAGCHLPSDCHYLTGNVQTEKRMLLLKRMLSQLGIEPQRLRLEWISASEGDKFASVVTEMVAELTQIGPSPLKTNMQTCVNKRIED